KSRRQEEPVDCAQAQPARAHRAELSAPNFRQAGQTRPSGTTPLSLYRRGRNKRVHVLKISVLGKRYTNAFYHWRTGGVARTFAVQSDAFLREKVWPGRSDSSSFGGRRFGSTISRTARKLEVPIAQY